MNYLGRLRYVMWAVALAGLLAGAIIAGNATTPERVTAVGEPTAGTVARVSTFTLLSATSGVTGTVYTDAPNLADSGLDMSRVAEWHSADIFVTADLTGSGILTVTPQFSADQSNWADADYSYVATTATITNSGAITSTQVTVSSIANQDYRAILTADGTEYMRVPVAGEYMRLKLERTGTIAVAIDATMRND